VPQQPVKPHSSAEFIRKSNDQPQRTIEDVRKERRTVREDGRVFIHEGDRTIVRENNHTIIRHNEDQRFAIGARDVHVDHRDGQTLTVIMRPDGVRIINITDDEGHLVRRVRRNPDGREYIIIDNRNDAPRDVFVDVPPPRVDIPRDRYIVDADRADEREIYDVLVAPPVEPVERDYSLAQVRYNAALRERMRRLDLDIHFDAGSWQVTPDQMDRLSMVAKELNLAIDHNPREVFLIEGHTDAVGSDEDNLSLSDRRAEAVAVALTEEFHVPAENLVTQGYGEQELKVPTQGPSRANRRVAIRRITPLIDRTVRR
jgi:outer membrane protein OmpA-like peptidoglycan-associated protein